MHVTLTSSIQLRLSDPLRTVAGQRYQFLTIELTSRDRLIEPQDLTDLSLPAGIDTTGGVVITGRAPLWLYSYLVHELHPTAWVACFDPRFNAGVVVATHSRLARVGQVIPLEQPTSSLAPALLVVGPPDSGKSVFSHVLFQALLPDCPDVFLQRANWDGEGNWILELPPAATPADQETFKRLYKGGLTERFFPYQSEAILQLRHQKPLVIVDVGGMVQTAKLPLLEACSHYVIISADPGAVDEWHEFCCDRANLKPVAVIHSCLTETLHIHQRQPYLEITCGPWVRGKTNGVPEICLEQVKELISRSP